MAEASDGTLLGFEALRDLPKQDAEWLLQFAETGEFAAFVRLFIEPMIIEKLNDLEKAENAKARHVLWLLRRIQNLRVEVLDAIGDARPQIAQEA